MKRAFFLAFRNLWRNPSRTAISVLSVAGGVVAFLLASGFIEWIFQDMRESTIRSQLGHLQIVKPHYFDKGIADPYAFLLPAASAEQTLIEQTSGVLSLAPRLAFSGLISHGEATIAFIGEGVDPEREQGISSRVTITQGRDLLDGSSRKRAAVLLGEGLANSLGVAPGDSVVLLATTANGSPNALELQVAGTFATVSKEYDDRALRLPIASARKLMRVDGATTWVALLDRTEQTEQVAKTLSTLLPRDRFEVVPWTALADFYNKTVVLFSKQVNVLKLIVSAIIILTISNTQMMNVLERTTEIGTSLAVGQRRKFVLHTFLTEGFLLGVFGGVSGLALALLASTMINAIGIPMPPPPGMARGYVAQIVIPFSLALEAVILAFGTTLLASILPAWKASRLNIVDALRYNQ